MECPLCFEEKEGYPTSCTVCVKSWCMECEDKIDVKKCPFCRTVYGTPIANDTTSFHSILLRNVVIVDDSLESDLVAFVNQEDEWSEDEDSDSREIDYPDEDEYESDDGDTKNYDDDWYDMPAVVMFF